MNVYPGVRTLRALNCQNELLADEKKVSERKRRREIKSKAWKCERKRKRERELDFLKEMPKLPFESFVGK